MKDCQEIYYHKNWLIYFSEYRQGWIIEPTEKLLAKIDKNMADDILFISEEWIHNTNYSEKNLESIKKFIDDNERKLIIELIDIATSWKHWTKKVGEYKIGE